MFIGDPHLKINRFDLSLQFLSWINRFIAEQKPDVVVNLGDTFDTHAVVRSEVMCEFMLHVSKTLALGIEYVYLVGNHDMYKPSDSKYHVMKPFKNTLKGLHVIDEVTELYGMTFVPYQYYGSNFPKKTLPICVAHQTFIGADYGPVRATEGVDAASIEGCELVISGHIHTKSVLGSVLYVGSPFSQSAADVDQVKGITILDTDTYKQSFHQCPLPMWRRIRLELNQCYDVDAAHRDISASIAGSKDHWIVELTGPRAEVTGYVDSARFKKMVGEVDVKVKPEFTDKEKRKVSIEAKSMEHIISEYVAKVYNGALNKEDLLVRAKAVLSESRVTK